MTNLLFDLQRPPQRAHRARDAGHARHHADVGHAASAQRRPRRLDPSAGRHDAAGDAASHTAGPAAVAQLGQRRRLPHAAGERHARHAASDFHAYLEPDGLALPGPLNSGS